MKSFGLLILLLSHFLVSGQETPQFKIICASEGVKLDGEEVGSGLEVFANSQRLSIPRKGYAGILTIDGYAFMLKRSMSVSNIILFVPTKSKERNMFGYVPGAGAVQRGSNDRVIEITPGVGMQNALIAGDHLVLHCSDTVSGRNKYIIRFSDFYGNPILIDTVTDHLWVYNRKALMRHEGGVMFNIRPLVNQGNNYQTHVTKNQFLIPLGQDSVHVLHDLLAIPITEPDPEIIRMAIYEIYNLVYDNFATEYLWVIGKRPPRSQMANNYWKNQSLKPALYWFHMNN